MARKRTGKQEDRVEFGSDTHAGLLGLVKVPKSPAAPDGWALADPTAWGPAASDKFLADKLAQAVRVLNTKPEVPDNAPPLGTPDRWKQEQEELEA